MTTFDLIDLGFIHKDVEGDAALVFALPSTVETEQPYLVCFDDMSFGLWEQNQDGLLEYRWEVLCVEPPLKTIDEVRAFLKLMGSEQ